MEEIYMSWFVGININEFTGIFFTKDMENWADDCEIVTDSNFVNLPYG